MTKNKGETWIEAALRYAKPYGLQWEVTTVYERCLKAGAAEEDAAYAALSEWDLLDLCLDD
jgi:hypothetical protein